MKSMRGLVYVAAASTMVLFCQLIVAADVTGDRAKIGGGHILNGVNSSITGGTNNTVSTNGDYAIIGGGGYNVVTNYGVVGGGRSNKVYGSFGAIVGGHSNTNWDTAGFIGGGGFNISLSYGSVGGGYQNLASSYAFIGGGFQNDTYGGYADVIGGGFQNVGWGQLTFTGGGRKNANYGFAGVIGGGDSNATLNAYATIPGGAQAYADKFGQQAYAGGAFKDIGDAQTSLFVLRQTTTSTNTGELFLDGAGERMLIAPGSVWAFEALVSAGSTNGNAAGFQFSGVIKNVGGTTTLVGSSKTVLARDVVSWDANVLADNGSDALVIKANGDATRVRWVAKVRTSEVIP